MKLGAYSIPNRGYRLGIRLCVIPLIVLTSLVMSNLIAAQTDAPGETVIIPGREISDWGQVAEVSGRFGIPAGSAQKTPAVLILHGSGGVDGRGAFHAKALQEAGIATLEITMFLPGGRPKTGSRANMPHAAAALKWLSEQPNVKGQRLGVLGFSWGGVMSVMMSSEFVQERIGKDVPKPAAFAAFYPVCTTLYRAVQNPQHFYYNAPKRMSANPMLIFVGTKDDYEEGDRPCDALIEMWPTTAREQALVRYIEGATHGFDTQTPGKEFNDEFAHGGRGGKVSVVPSQKDAVEARQEIVNFFIKNLKP